MSVTTNVRTLAWYEKDPGNRFIEEAELKGADLESLEQLFDISRDNPMYDCYPVSSTNLAQLQAYVDVIIELDKYDYFIECRTTEDQ